MKFTFIIISLIIFISSAIGQTYSTRNNNDNLYQIHLDSSEIVFNQKPNFLKIRVFKNNKEINIPEKINVQLFSDNTEVKRVDTTNEILFPKIDIYKPINLKIYIGGELHNFSGLFGDDINKGGEFLIVEISNINKLLSVAEYSNMDKNDTNYKTYRSRFFIANHHSIDLPDYKKIKKVNCIIFIPRCYGDGTYIMMIENIKYKI